MLAALALLLPPAPEGPREPRRATPLAGLLSCPTRRSCDSGPLRSRIAKAIFNFLWRIIAVTFPSLSFDPVVDPSTRCSACFLSRSAELDHSGGTALVGKVDEQGPFISAQPCSNDALDALVVHGLDVLQVLGGRGKAAGYAAIRLRTGPSASKAQDRNRSANDGNKKNLAHEKPRTKPGASFAKWQT
jgi:hypothetical protein